MEALAELWRTLTRPAGEELLTRLKWLGVVVVVVVLAGLWIGQYALAGNPAYYPGERWRIALAWTLLILAFLLALLLTVGWWFGGIVAPVAIAVHIAVMVAAVFAVVLLMPEKPAAPCNVL